MIYDNQFMAPSKFAPYAFRVREPGELLIDWEPGGSTLDYPSDDFTEALWELTVDQIDPYEFKCYIGKVGTTPTLRSTHNGTAKMVCLTFTGSMNPIIGYVLSSGEAYISYFDGYNVKISDGPVKAMVAARDYLGPAFAKMATAVFIYHKGDKLYYISEKDYFGVEHELAAVPSDGVLVAAGPNVSGSLQVRMEGLVAGAATDGGEVRLSEIAEDLFRRSNVSAQHLDTSDISELTVGGYRVVGQAGADANFGPLMQACFISVGEWDKKIRFVRLGKAPVAEIAFGDMVDNDVVLERERVNEIELMRKVNVEYIDSKLGWVPNTQTDERRAITVQAVGESSISIPISCTPDFAKTIAMKRLRMPWCEPHTFNFGLSIRHAALTPTDVVKYTDNNGNVFVMRLTRSEDDYGNFSIEAVTNSTTLYDKQAKGVEAPVPAPSVPGQAGDTIVVPINIPVFRDQDDEFGYYVAVRGTGNGWSGGLLQISLDGGATVLQSLDVDVPAAIGETVTALLPEASSEYLSQQTLRVTLPETPESINRTDVLRYRNLAAVERADGSWEVLQWQVATPVDETTYDLSGLVRGRYATEPLAVPAGGRFVLLDSSVTFVRLQQWMLGETVSYRGVTYNQNADDVPWESFTVDDPKSQREWPVHHVRRDGDTVSWVGRARLGVEVAPHNSKYFAGYRVTYSDGYTADTTEQTYTRAGTPGGVTVTVAAINTITGLGPASEAI